MREYIIVDTAGQYVERFTADERGLYGQGDILGAREILTLTALQDISIPLWEVFEVEGPEAA